MSRLAFLVQTSVDDAEVEKLNRKRKAAGRALTTAKDEAENALLGSLQHNFLFDPPITCTHIEQLDPACVLTDEELAQVLDILAGHPPITGEKFSVIKQKLEIMTGALRA